MPSRLVKRQRYLMLGGCQIGIRNHIKILEVHLDTKVNFGNHIKELTLKSKKHIKNLRLVKTSWVARTTTYLAIYKSHID